MAGSDIFRRGAGQAWNINSASIGEHRQKGWPSARASLGDQSAAKQAFVSGRGGQDEKVAAARNAAEIDGGIGQGNASLNFSSSGSITSNHRFGNAGNSICCQIWPNVSVFCQKRIFGEWRSS
jgi:hypothetical protein